VASSFSIVVPKLELEDVPRLIAKGEMIVSPKGWNMSALGIAQGTLANSFRKALKGRDIARRMRKIMSRTDCRALSGRQIL